QATTALLFLTNHATVWRVALLQMVFGVAGAFTRPGIHRPDRAGRRSRAPAGGECAARSEPVDAPGRRAGARRPGRRRRKPGLGSCRGCGDVLRHGCAQTAAADRRDGATSADADAARAAGGVERVRVAHVALDDGCELRAVPAH